MRYTARLFVATWRARKSTASATGIVVSAALCVRLGRPLLSAGRPRPTLELQYLRLVVSLVWLFSTSF
jgi:hypothetical protein